MCPPHTGLFNRAAAIFMNDRAYVKLFSRIVTSSMWSEDSDTRVVWVTMMALANQYGEVMASIPGLARTANVTVEKCQEALAKFLAPDPFSRTKAHEGKRVGEIPGGWRLLNWDLYRELMSLEERREYKRVKEAERRERKRGQSVDKRGQSVDKSPVHVDKKSTYSDTDTEADKEREREGSCATSVEVPPMTKQEWVRAGEMRAWPPDCTEHYWNELEACGWVPEHHVRPLGTNQALAWMQNRVTAWRAKGMRANGSSTPLEFPGKTEWQREEDAEMRRISQKIADAKAKEARERLKQS